MKRSELVDKLIKEGMSEKTLVKFTDKQLNNLAERMIGEAITTTADALSKSAALQNLAKKQDIKLVGEEGEVSEELKGNQSKIDKNKNGKIDSEDFKLLKNKKKEVKEECCPKCGVVGCKCGEKKKLDKKKLDDIDKKEIKEWVDSLVENDYHSLTTKDEIMELIKIKLHEQPDVMEPDIDVEPDIDIDPDIDAPPSPDKDPFIDPWQNPGEGPDPRPKFEKGNGGSMPAFMEFKNILNF
jgi:hypothetical protein